MQQASGFSASERSFIRGQMVDEFHLDSLENWYPVAIDPHTDSVFWRDMGQQRFVESFFHNSLDAQAREARRVCKTKVSSLAKIRSTVAPSAFIFHISRCGSTLLTQMLASLTSCIVLSEPPVIDMFCRNYLNTRDQQIGHENQIQIFRQLIAALGQQRFPAESHLIIKLDSWHIGHCEFIREAYPDVPMYFLFRDPKQVLASHRKQRGPQMIPDYLDLGNIKAEKTGLEVADLDGYCLRILDQFFATALSHADNQQLRLLNYKELPNYVWDRLLNELGISCSPAEMQEIRQRSGYHSKHTLQSFSERLEEQAPHAFFAHTFSLYEQLESMRQQQG